MNEKGYVPHGSHHEEPGEGCTLYCPRVFGVPGESCTCETPCKDAHDRHIEIEWVRRCRGKDQ